MMATKLQKTLDDVSGIFGFIIDPAGVTRKGGAVDIAIDRVVGTVGKVNEQVVGMADATIGHVEDLLDPNEGSQMATTTILWVAVAAGAAIVIYMIVRAWRK